MSEEFMAKKRKLCVCQEEVTMLYSSDSFLYKSTPSRPIDRSGLSSKRNEQQRKQKRKLGSVNELILSDNPWQSDFILTPILNQLADNSEQRWLTLVLSDDASDKTRSWLKQSGINHTKVQVINPKGKADLLELTRKALASGTSHTVISWLNEVDNENLDLLESAAKNGHCQALAIRSRNRAA
ncbi:hypothetical protein EOPP23_14470 [Endozoicomonas sp. OPT23]|uniref:cell division inhibitor SulA n=1 Tax=Endozoicomonas sp. OPT23 TaxID=2072845 RepID=UPI00129C070D|nr:SulA-like leucine-rich domain-containing protein [Endozoicomonas sp. OPT23]MRI34195.1 hypothetical protein [Endozoicomonas sp. OPT23]